MQVIKAYLNGLKMWKHWDGRTRRRDYWYYVLCHSIIVALLYPLITFCFSSDEVGLIIFSLLLSFAYACLTFAPTLAITIRRLHDTGKSGFYFFISAIPYIGSIWFLILMCKDSQPGKNKYGQNPKEVFYTDVSTENNDLKN